MAIILSGCLAQTSGPRPEPRPESLKVPEVYTPSADSQALTKYYADLEQDLLTRGLLRTDGGGPDTPYDAEDLAEHFDALAFYDEYASVDSSGSGGLARWVEPVKIRAVFGPSATARQKEHDLDILTRYTARLAEITGHPISLTTGRNANFTVFFTGLDDAEFVQTRVRKLLPHMGISDLSLFAMPPRRFYCLVTAGGLQSDPLTYTRGVALIRTEQPDLMREACIHEEIAQGLGLRNDSPKARPSIFNDDDEFARLTSHDEKLLQMLYDPRLRPGMSASEARPIVTRLAQEQMGLIGF